MNNTETQLEYQKLTTAFLYTNNINYCKPVQVVSYKTIESLKLQLSIIEPYIRARRCYGNAYNVSIGIPGIEYVEGQAFINTPMPYNHAWNYYPEDDVYFDMTWEIHCPEIWSNFNTASCYYFETIKGTIDCLLDEGYTFNTSIDVHTQWLNSPAIKAEIENTPNSLFNLLQRNRTQLETTD